MSKPAKKPDVAALPAQSVAERLRYCGQMLFLHGYLSEQARDSLRRRIDAKEGKPCSTK